MPDDSEWDKVEVPKPFSSLIVGLNIEYLVPTLDSIKYSCFELLERELVLE